MQCLNLALRSLISLLLPVILSLQVGELLLEVSHSVSLVDQRFSKLLNHCVFGFKSPFEIVRGFDEGLLLLLKLRLG